MKSIFKCLLILSFVILLAGCRDKVSSDYLMRHPNVLKKEIERCHADETKTREMASHCEVVMSAAEKFIGLLKEQQSDLEKSGVHLTIWPIPHDQLPKWIIQRAKKYKLALKPEAATLIADYVEGNLIAAAQVLEKIYLLKPGDVIDTTLAESVLVNESRYTIFDFIDALIAGDSARSLAIMANLKFEGIEPVLILWAITRELRIMADMGQKSRQGVSLDLLLQQHRIFARRQASVRRFLDKFNHEACWHLLEQAATLDKIIKGAIPGNIWEGLQLFCLKII